MSARKLLSALFIAASVAGSTVRANDPAPTTAPSAVPSPAEALQSLEEGNVRFQAGAAEGPRRDDVRRGETFSKGQHPFAAVLSCADSRVPPELLFDTGIGDLFVVRVAGNVADTDEIGTLEYGVEHLHTPLIVVVGHTKCGAVTAVVDGAKVPENIALLVDNIAPAVETTRTRFPSLKGAGLVQQAIRMNVRQSMADMFKRSEIIREAVQNGDLKVIGAVYDINSGSLEWMGPHPDETALLGKANEGVASTDEHAGAHSGELVKDAKTTDSHAAPAHGAPAKDPHAAPAKDPHAAPAKGEHDPHAAPPTNSAHGEKSKAGADAHGEASHDAHDPHDAGEDEEHPTTQPTDKQAKTGPIPHNFVALGGCLAGGAVMSVLTIHLTKVKKAAKPVEKTTEKKPAAAH